MRDVFTLVSISIIAICYGIDEAEYGIIKSLQSKTDGNITQLGSLVTKSYLACQRECIQVASCDSSVYCSGSCLLFSTRTATVGIDVVGDNNRCRLSTFPSRLVCGRHGVKNGNKCTCDEGWIGMYCDIPPLGEIAWIEQFNSQSENGTSLDMALRNGVSLMIVEHSNDKYIYYKPIYYTSGETTYAQTIFEVSPTPGKLLYYNRMFNKDGKVSSVSSDGQFLSSTSTLTWFTKDYSRGIPFFTRNADTVTLGSLTDCAAQIQNGGEIRAVVDDAGVVIDVDLDMTSQEIKFLFPLHTRANNTDDGNFALTSSWSLIVGTLSSRVIYLMNVDFKGGVTSRRYQQIPTNTLNFFLDPAWKQVYRVPDTTENSGNQGSYQILRDAIHSGKKLRVIFQHQNDRKILTIKHIEVRANKIIAFSAAQPVYRNIKENVSPRVRFYSFDHNGELAFCSVDLGSVGLQSSEEGIMTNSVWFAENKQWYPIFKLNNKREILTGSVQRLILAAQSGKSLRFSTRYEEHHFFVTDIESAEISTNNDILFASRPLAYLVGSRYCSLISYHFNGSFSLSFKIWHLKNDNVLAGNYPLGEHTFFTDDPLA